MFFNTTLDPMGLDLEKRVFCFLTSALFFLLLKRTFCMNKWRARHTREAYWSKKKNPNDFRIIDISVFTVQQSKYKLSDLAWSLT